MKYPWAKVGVKVTTNENYQGLSQEQIDFADSVGVDVPREGKVYEIEQIGICAANGFVGVLFKGLRFSPSDCGGQCMWPIIAFSPLTEDRSRTQSQVDKLKRIATQSPISVKGVDA